MKNIFSRSIIIITIAIALYACHPDKATQTPSTGTAALHVVNTAGSQALVLNTGVYANANGDTVTISLFEYYLSNIVLHGASTYTENNSYHLLTQSDGTSLNMIFNNVPVGTYNSMSFLIGVDSLHNVSGAQTGALDPLNGMFWSWNTGYIMGKLEGTSPQSTGAGKKFAYHIGGFSGPYSTVKSVTLNFSTPLVITKNNTSAIYLHADALKWFSPNTIRLAVLNDLALPGDSAAMIANNYAQMMGVDSVKN